VKRVMVRYTVKPERAAENVELVRAVYDELHGAQAAEGLGFDIRRSTSSRPRMNTSPSPTYRPSGASRGIPESCEDAPVVSRGFGVVTAGAAFLSRFVKGDDESVCGRSDASDRAAADASFGCHGS
jgi:hypothetical protein